MQNTQLTATGFRYDCHQRARLDESTSVNFVPNNLVGKESEEVKGTVFSCA